MAETIRVVREGGLVEVVLNRPDKLNSINRLMLSELREALEEATEAPARALLLRGAGRAFSAGRDLAEADPQNEDAAEIWCGPFAPLLTQIYEFRAPTIVSCRAYACMGGGLGLAFACDLRIAADDAQISSPFGRLGAVLDSGGHFHFARLLWTPPRARTPFIYTGRRLPATRGGGAWAGEPLCRGLPSWKGPRASSRRKSQPGRRLRFAFPNACCRKRSAARTSTCWRPRRSRRARPRALRTTRRGCARSKKNAPRLSKAGSAAVLNSLHQLF